MKFKNIVMRVHLLLGICLANLSLAQSSDVNSVTKNEMQVSWSHSNESIEFIMRAPTTGWVTIGFNDKDEITNAYLLMGRIVGDKAELMEHYTVSPGKYKSLLEMGESSSIQYVKGTEADHNTSITFSLPQQARNKYGKNLTKEMTYYLIMAYSVSDDFQHHSSMRTSLQVQL